MFSRRSEAPTSRRRTARFGAKPALAHAVIVLLAFSVAGVLTQVAVDREETAALRERVRGEVRSLQEEWRQRGIAHLPHTLQKRVRLWRGFAYGLAPVGGGSEGWLKPGVEPGWTLHPGKADDADLAHRPYLTQTVRLPDGARLVVGQDLSSRRRSSAALSAILLICGGVGAAFCVAASVAFSRDDRRRVVALAAVARDVRGGRLARRATLRSGGAPDDIDDLATAFNALLDHTEVLLAQVRRVSAGIAHDLRTPLTRVMQRLERLRATTAGADGLSLQVERLQDDLQEVLRTFDALLQLAEIEQASAAAPSAKCDLGEVAHRVVEAFRPDVEEGGRSISADLAFAPVRAEPQLVSQAVANLLENAMRHTPSGSSIFVRVRAVPTPHLVVSDDGPGVPEAHRAEVVRPLVRLEASRSTPGSGLGLAMVAAVAARHNAELTLTDAGPGLAVKLAFA